MIIGRITGWTRHLGKSQGYLGLPVKDTTIHDTVHGPGTECMETAWEPTPQELAWLNEGAPVILRVLGVEHPPVMVEVRRPEGR